MNHYLICQAPICKESIEQNFKNELIWYAGEPVCQKSPYDKFQKKQLEINKDVVNKDVASGHFRKLEEPYTAYELETKSI